MRPGLPTNDEPRALLACVVCDQGWPTMGLGALGLAAAKHMKSTGHQMRLIHIYADG